MEPRNSTGVMNDNLTPENISLAQATRAVAAINEIVEWANSSHDYLSESTQYAMGYKHGIATGKEVVENILAQYKIQG